MAFYDNFEDLELKGELGRGAYGRVYVVKYCETICAAKEIHSILVEGVGQVQMQRTVESFMRECRQCSTLRHPNVIQFLGVYYPTGAGGADGMRLPVMVMEMMADSLASFVDKHEKIPVHIKYSIVHDVSLGLCYLHNHDTPIVHRDLSPNNVLLTAHYVAKISDLGVAKVIKPDSKKTMTKAPGTIDFMPPEALAKSPVYGPPMDVFSFAGVTLHTFNQQWPSPSEQVEFDPETRTRVALSEVKRRQQYLDKMIGEAEVLRPLVEECLDDDPAVRPTIATVSERIQVSKDAYMKESPQNIITLHQQLEQFSEEIKCKEMENLQLRNENELQNTIIAELRTVIDQMSSTRTQQVASQESMTTANGSKLKTAPPLISSLTSGRYHIKWTQLTDLPIPLYNTYAAVQHHKIYVTGRSSVNDAKHQIYVYNIDTDQWGQLSLSGHYYGVPHVIGDKLAIIGGYWSSTTKMTNKVSTFDEDSHTWTSYYPDLLSVRSRPGVVSYLEHVIVAGGKCIDEKTIQDDIEVLNWMENSHWRKVSIKLPVPMYNFTPTIFDDNLLIVGYYGADRAFKRSAYKLPIANITTLFGEQHNSYTFSEIIAPTHLLTALVPNLSPPAVVGGWKQNDNTSTADIEMYDNSDHSWKKIGSLPSARSEVAVAAVYNNAIIIIGGCTKVDTLANRYSSSVTVVELGQTECVEFY